MFAKVESFLHRVRRRLSRSEWAIRHLGLTPSEGTSEAPGLLLLQIDGCARGQLERAIAANRMPFLRRLLQREGYELHTFYPGVPATTPAVQAELYYGGAFGGAGVQFLRSRAGQARPDVGSRMGQGARGGVRQAGGGTAPRRQFVVEHLHGRRRPGGEPLLRGEHRARRHVADEEDPKHLRLHDPEPDGGAAHHRAHAGGDRGRIWRRDARDRERRRPYKEFLLLLSAVFDGVGLRELLKISGQIEVARGMPIVHITSSDTTRRRT